MEPITVFTPAYNRANLLCRCFESMKRQTRKDFIWMIIDDGSKDNTREIVESWLRESLDFELQYHYKENGGLHIAPEMDDDKGTSVVLVQSDRGAAVLNQLRDKLVVKTVTLEEASRQNPAMLVSAKPNPKRTEAMELIRGDGIGNCETWFPKPAESTPLRLVPRIRRLLARIKRKLWPDR